jgi:hypothetical protein
VRCSSTSSNLRPKAAVEDAQRLRRGLAHTDIDERNVSRFAGFGSLAEVDEEPMGTRTRTDVAATSQSGGWHAPQDPEID